MHLHRDHLASAPVEALQRLARALGVSIGLPRRDLLDAVERAANSRAPVPVMPRLPPRVVARRKSCGDAAARPESS